MLGMLGLAPQGVRRGAQQRFAEAAVRRAISGGAEGVVHMNSDRCLDPD
jgi:hypothetical protein